MNLSKIDICNLALAHLGQASINAISDENERARKCKLFYDVALGETLRAHPWKFAENTAPLALLDVHADGWAFAPTSTPQTPPTCKRFRPGAWACPSALRPCPKRGA